MYGEDIDLSYRIILQGYQNRYLPLPIVHYKGESTIKTSYRYAKVFYDAMLIFYNKHFRRHSALFTLLVKTGVGIKKVTTFVLQNISVNRRMLSHYTEKCLYVGRKETFTEVSGLIGKSAILSSPVYIEGSENIESLLNGHLGNGIGAVLFDTDAFSLDAILDWMYSRASEGKHYNTGFYSAKTGKLITENETL